MLKNGRKAGGRRPGYGVEDEDEDKDNEKDRYNVTKPKWGRWYEERGGRGDRGGGRGEFGGGGEGGGF